MSMPVSAVGIVWYRRENYAACLAVMADRHLLPKTFDEWLRAAEEGVERLRTQGHTVHKVQIDPIEFKKWCIASGKNVDASGRTEYASWMAAKMQGQFGPGH